MKVKAENTDIQNDKSLVISAKAKQELTKNQKLFNKLSKKIQNLENEILLENQKLSNLLALFTKELLPVRLKNAHARIRLAMTIAASTEKFKYSKKQLDLVSEAIVTLCDKAFNDIQPNAEQEAFYDKWAENTYKETIADKEVAEKELFVSYAKDFFDMNVDFDTLKDNPEEFLRFKEELKQRINGETFNEQPNKKTKQQLAKENALKAQEELKNKSLRGIFITLAKVLHPDAETDDALKLEKEELMKQVTVAYENKDLPTLLKLETEWVHKTSEHLNNLTDEKLSLYLLALKQQVEDLEKQRDMVRMHPRFQIISEYIHISEKYALSAIKNESKGLKQAYKQIDKLSEFFLNPNSKQYIIEFAEVVREQNIEENLAEIFG